MAKIYRIDGVKLSNGKQAYGSKEMAAWLPVFIRYMKKVYGITIVVIKVNDSSSSGASASTHNLGFATDMRTYHLSTNQKQRVVMEGTKLGMPNCLRTSAQGFQPHDHGMLNVGYKTPCSYQIAALKNGRDGLARNRLDPDRHYRPAQPWMTWNEGLVAMLRVLNPVKMVPIPRVGYPKPWPKIAEDAILGPATIKRLQMTLKVRVTGKLDHYTVRALKVWLGNQDDGAGVVGQLHGKKTDLVVRQLQYRVKATRDGNWGNGTTLALQKYLNNNR